MSFRFHATGFFNPVFFRAQTIRFEPAIRCICGIAAMLAFSLIPRLAAAQATLLPTTELKVGSHAVTAEVAATEASRSYGLMNRLSLPQGHGMLFVFENDDEYCFWMKDTPLPLSIAFIDAKGAIVNTADMQPFSETPHCAAQPVRYALEMDQGWFAGQGVSAGTRVSGLPRN